MFDPDKGWNNNSLVGLDTRGHGRGRFPANIILDEEAARMLDEQSGEKKSGKHSTKEKDRKANGMFAGGIATDDNWYGDKGGASRFFYVAKASKAERNLGLEGFEKKNPLYGENMSSSDKGTISSSKIPSANNHPTVKSLKLMQYLCKLTKTPTGGIVLDPFVGSGTTCVAAKMEGREYIGIEKEEEYVKIAEARIKAVPSILF